MCSTDEEVSRMPCCHCSKIKFRFVQINPNFLKIFAILPMYLRVDGEAVSSSSSQPSGDRLKYLESRIAEIEEAYTCSICMERRRNVVNLISIKHIFIMNYLITFF